MKYYTNSQIENQFYKLTKNKQIEVLNDAIDYMQQYNGRTKLLCIAMAMGYENYEGSYDTYYKKNEKTKKITS